MKKHTLSLLLAASMLSLSACGGMLESRSALNETTISDETIVDETVFDEQEEEVEMVWHTPVIALSYVNVYEENGEVYEFDISNHNLNDLIDFFALTGHPVLEDFVAYGYYNGGENFDRYPPLEETLQDTLEPFGASGVRLYFSDAVRPSVTDATQEQYPNSYEDLDHYIEAVIYNPTETEITYGEAKVCKLGHIRNFCYHQTLNSGGVLKIGELDSRDILRHARERIDERKNRFDPSYGRGLEVWGYVWDDPESDYVRPLRDGRQIIVTDGDFAITPLEFSKINISNPDYYKRSDITFTVNNALIEENNKQQGYYKPIVLY